MHHRQLVQLLTRAESLCRAWEKQHSVSTSLLMSLANIHAQHSAATLQKFNFDVDMPRLLYKQQLAFENALKKLNRVMLIMTDIVADLQVLENEAGKFVARAVPTMPLQPQPLSTESLLQIAAVQPHDVHRYISGLHSMLDKELAYKKTWLNSLSSSSSLEEVCDYWERQPHIDSDFVAQLSDRIKLYKQTHRVLTSTD
ncbi:hypothetical protein BX666DRAFT_2123839 [Dichotomocladium elegans]|nr:hypothetical protein BX666DRAFT_2123839 [Dichotomocladium elegans]